MASALLENSEYIEVALLSRDPSYGIENSIFSLESDIGRDKLNSLLAKLLNRNSDDLLFDFYINQTPLGTKTLKQFIIQHNIKTERNVEIEYEIRKSAVQNVKTMQHGNLVHGIDYNGKTIISGCYDKNVYIWNSKGNLICKYCTHERPVKCVSIVHNINHGFYFASSGQDTFIALSYFNDQSLQTSTICKFEGHSATVLSLLSLNSSTDRYIVSTAFDGSIKIWDVSDDSLNEFHQKSIDLHAKKVQYETPLMVIGHHNAPATGVCAFGEAKVLTCGWDATIKMWDISSASCVSTLNGTAPYTHVSYSPFQKLAACGSKQKYVQLFDVLSNGFSVINLTLDSCHENSVSTVNWSESDDYLLLTTSWDGSAYIWDIRSYKEPYLKVMNCKQRLMSSCWKNKMCLIGSDSGSLNSYLL